MGEKEQPEKGTDKNLTFLDHLEELRWRLLKSLVCIFLCSFGAYFFSEQIVSFLAKPLPIKKLIFLGPTEAFLVRFKAALLAGITISLPYIFYQIWKFMAPGLYEKEKKYILGFITLSTLFFLSGVTFVYYVILPIGLHFLLGFQTDILRPTISVDKYFGFIFKMFLAFGVIFEMPILAFFLTKIGLIDAEFIRKKRRYAYVIMLILSALLTPPDIFTQALMAIPLILLFEVSIVVSKLSK